MKTFKFEITLTEEDVSGDEWWEQAVARDGTGVQELTETLVSLLDENNIMVGSDRDPKDAVRFIGFSETETPPADTAPNQAQHHIACAMIGDRFAETLRRFFPGSQFSDDIDEVQFLDEYGKRGWELVFISSDHDMRKYYFRKTKS